MLASRLSSICLRRPELANRILFRINQTKNNKIIAIPGRNSSSSTSTFQKAAETFFQKHANRGSPQSPYMLGLAYNVQLTSALSLTHRITGIGLGVLIYGFGIAQILNPNKNFAQLLDDYVKWLPNFGPDLIKLLCGTALAYHTFNGIRHLCWDMGYGFSLQRLYMTGYIVIGLTILSVAAMIAQSQMQ